jgi:hypothetical protein
MVVELSPEAAGSLRSRFFGGAGAAMVAAALALGVALGPNLRRRFITRRMISRYARGRRVMDVSAGLPSEEQAATYEYAGVRAVLCWPQLLNPEMDLEHLGLGPSATPEQMAKQFRLSMAQAPHLNGPVVPYAVTVTAPKSPADVVVVDGILGCQTDEEASALLSQVCDAVVDAGTVIVLDATRSNSKMLNAASMLLVKLSEGSMVQTKIISAPWCVARCSRLEELESKTSMRGTRVALAFRIRKSSPVDTSDSAPS